MQLPLQVSFRHIEHFEALEAVVREKAAGLDKFAGDIMSCRVANRFQQLTGVDVRRDSKAAWQLREAGELAKIELTTSTTTRVNLPFLSARGTEPLHLDTELTRAELERLLRPVIERCRQPVEQALHDAHAKR